MLLDQPPYPQSEVSNLTAANGGALRVLTNSTKELRGVEVLTFQT
jgi:hypothetical protein